MTDPAQVRLDDLAAQRRERALNGIRSRALVEYANRRHVVDERGWCSCNMYAPGDDGDCPERARLFADSLAIARGDAPRASRVLILAQCGHWWIEHRPDNLKVDHAAPRVCAICRPDEPAAVGTSPQGLALVPVTYIDEWTEERP